MIRLQRPAEPAQLVARKVDDTAALWKALEAGKALKFRQQTYAHRAVKAALKTAQRGKCAYCETHLPRSHALVEHFRPKAGWRTTRGAKLTTPGYFWLAYDWSNLLFACDTCNNAAHKGNLFPLAEGSRRASAKLPSIAQEKPLLLNPYVDDPAQHIEWHRDIPKGIKGSQRGWVTIKELGLAEDNELAEWRRGYLEDLEEWLLAVEEGALPPQGRARCVAILKRAMQDDAPYLAMVRASFGNRIQTL